MEDRKLEAAESLELIGRMIENTRSRIVRNSGRPLLAWGYATVVTTIIVWAAVVGFRDPRWNSARAGMAVDVAHTRKTHRGRGPHVR